MNTYARPAEGAEDQKPDQEPRPDQEPLTLALSRRERGLIALFGRGAPTWDTESNSNFENRPPLPRERAGGEGKIHHKTNADRIALPPHNRMSVSSAELLIFRPVGRLSGGIHPGRTSKGGAAKQAGIDAPDGSRSEGTPSPSEWAERQGKAFLVTFSASGKSDPP